MVIDRIALVLVIIGALNWLCVGIFQFDFVAWICSGASYYLGTHYIFHSGYCRPVVHISAVPQKSIRIILRPVHTSLMSEKDMFMWRTEYKMLKNSKRQKLY